KPMDFKDTKYEGRGVVQETTLSGDHSEILFDDPRQISFDDLSQLHLLSNSGTQQKIEKDQGILRSKYEMNLAEFPLALLSKKQPKKPEAIEYQDTISGKDGEIVTRMWRVKPSHDYGFGSTALTALLFELFQLWKEQGFKSRKIDF